MSILYLLVIQFERKTNNFYALFYYKTKGRTFSPTLKILLYVFYTSYFDRFC